ncbi:hypothetical protein DDB_G0287955 [Dictyostelium discoideum AX4]|uniref:MRH domain-containing protein n=1 Tax=Dictyostelium discoideum TaxID=44689 RepID=Q54JM4_DICDI|nr:hypothetical protein DDB_G0287955 [Dictyostelium discoideum AX4]EAL63458.1 hypothetical protein DDB_G0287955 [Dictyostelium discoideum AX4]|eukprot:XP_636962.1 hypothetical protein DDB_G0287955 [Dictyostelium discoideum AX4]
MRILLLLFLLIVANFHTISSNCIYYDPLRNQTYDLKTIFKQNEKNYFTTGNSSFGYNGEHFSINFNLCNDIDYSYCNGISSICQYFYDENSFKGIFDLGTFSNVEFDDNQLTIVYKSIVFDKNGYNDCSGAIEKNRRVTYFNFQCDYSIDVINNTNEIVPIEDGFCKYQVYLKSKSFCTTTSNTTTTTTTTSAITSTTTTTATTTTNDNNENECSKSHTIYYNSIDNSCECDSQSTGKQCEISKMFFSSISYVQEKGGLVFLNGYFGTEYRKSKFNITIGDNNENCRNVTQLSESLIKCDIGPGFGFKDVYLEDRGLSIYKQYQLQYIGNINTNANNNNNNNANDENDNSSNSIISGYKIEIIVLACAIVASIIIMIFTYRFIKKRQEKLKIEKTQQLNSKNIIIA